MDLSLKHLSFLSTFLLSHQKKNMFCSFIINGCSLEIVVKCGHFISVFIQHFNVANALRS